MESRVFHVSELNQHIKMLMDSDPTLSDVLVDGELSNYKIYPSGHHYFSLKDAEGAMRCVMFRGSAGKLQFQPQNGMRVVVRGRITVFPRDGAYQLYATEMTVFGAGDLHIAFEQLKEKLYKEGLFDAQWKKPIPRYPERIAVITSSAGAAVRDIIRVLRARYPLAKVLLLPVRVQGTEAPPEIVGAIRYANRYHIGDVIITGRGGGSIEDLWAFNDERVARAIFESEIPVISAVGHEPDFTIADFVADLRAATPSNGAELAVPDQSELRDALASLKIRAVKAVENRIQGSRQQLEQIAAKRVMKSPTNYIDDKRMLLEHLREKMASAQERCLSQRRQQYVRLASQLDAMSPLKVLSRGYAIAKKENGTIIRDASQVQNGDKIRVLIKQNQIRCTVDEQEN